MTIAQKIIGYKFIEENMKSHNGNHTWKVGKWYKYESEIELCKSGFHACKKPHEALQFIYGDRFFKVEAKGKIIYEKNGDKKFVASEMRLVKELPLKEISVKYACYCARQCLKNYEKEYPNDKRPFEAIKAAEDYMDKKITLDELQTKISAAWSAESAARSAESAAESAARSAAWSAAEYAARSAESAARSAAWSAAEYAARSAESAAWSAAEYALNKEFDKIVRSYL